MRFSAMLATGSLVASLVAAAAPPSAATDWTTFGFDAQRTGYNPAETVLGPGNAGGLKLAWSLVTGDTILTQPVVIGTKVYVGTLGGDLVAADRVTGEVAWTRATGSHATGCDNPAKFGIVGTPTLAGSSLFFTSADGKLHAVDPASGAERPGWPVTITTRPLLEYVYTSPLLLGGSLYVETASNGCDHGTYRGQIAEVDIAGHKVVARWFPNGASGPGGGAMWGQGGVSADPGGGAIYALTGNAKHGKGVPENFGLSERVVRLTAALRVTASDYPGVAGAIENEFGATPVLFPAARVASGCLAAMNKNGRLLTYKRGAIGAGPVQQVQMSDFGNADFGSFIGSPAFDAAHGLLVVDNPTDSNTSTIKHGFVAMKVGAGCKLTLAWQRRVGQSLTGTDFPSIPPIVADGVVYGVRAIESTAYALDAATGAVLWDSGSMIRHGIFAPPTVANGQLLVAGADGTLYAFAAP